MPCPSRRRGGGSAAASRAVPVKRHSHPIPTAAPSAQEELLGCVLEQLGQQTVLLEQIRQTLLEQSGNKP